MNLSQRLEAAEMAAAALVKDKSAELSPEQLAVFDFWTTSAANFRFYPTPSGSIASACDRERKEHADVVVPTNWSAAQIETWGWIGGALQKLKDEY
jgi:hypothetical protein